MLILDNPDSDQYKVDNKIQLIVIVSIVVTFVTIGVLFLLCPVCPSKGTFIKSTETQSLSCPDSGFMRVHLAALKSVSHSSHGCQVQMGPTKPRKSHLPPLRKVFFIFFPTFDRSLSRVILEVHLRPHNRSVDWAVRGSLIATSYINSELCHSELY